MDAVLLAVAFLFGFLAQQVRLPPLVGFLASGFVLQALGYEGGATLSTLADLGVTLLLFSIGIKLQVRSLARPEIWAGTSLHACLMVAFFTPVVYLAALWVVPALGMDWQSAALVAFGLSFSSTVFAVKILEENGDTSSMHGRAAIGILIMQDILAVIFLTASTGKLPSPWAILLLATLIAGRPFFGWLIERCGHGELITLGGLVIALFVGAGGFETVGLKPDLGALFIGILLGYHPKAKEVSKALSGFVDLFLVGFFLQIGLDNPLTMDGFAWGLLFLALLPVKSLGFFFLLTRFHFRSRTGLLSALSLSTYSEFGLIVLSLAVANGWAPPVFLVAVAVALSLSIFIAAPLNRRAEAIYDPISDPLKKLETEGRHPDDLPLDPKGARIAVFGMGRVGDLVFSRLAELFPGRVVGFDQDPETVEQHRSAGRHILMADATDSDFWEKFGEVDSFDLVVLAMPNHTANMHAAETLKRHHCEAVVAATGKFSDEVKDLRRLEIDSAFNLYTEAGNGFANQVVKVFQQQRPELASQWQSPERRASKGSDV